MARSTHRDVVVVAIEGVLQHRVQIRLRDGAVRLRAAESLPTPQVLTEDVHLEPEQNKHTQGERPELLQGGKPSCRVSM